MQFTIQTMQWGSLLNITLQTALQVMEKFKYNIKPQAETNNDTNCY